MYFGQNRRFHTPLHWLIRESYITLMNKMHTLQITHIRIHPNFDGEDDQNENNFALIHFSKPVTLSSRVEPLCLPDHLELDEEDDLVVTGFTDLVDNPFLNLTTLSSSRCDELWVQYFNESNTTSAGKDVWCAAIDSNLCIHIYIKLIKSRVLI